MNLSLQKRYESPKVEVIEIERQGVLCASDGAAFSTGSGINGMNNGGIYGDNIIDETLWNNTFEANHAVFLPRTGGRIEGSSITNTDRSYYWSDTHSDESWAWDLRLPSSGNITEDDSDRFMKMAVRLVRNVQ